MATDIKNMPKGYLLEEIAILKKRMAEQEIYLSEMLRVEGALRSSEEKYRDLFENANDAIFLVDRNLNYIDVNKKAVEMFRYPKEEFLNMGILDMIPDGQVQRSEKELHKLAREGSYRNFVGKARTKDGRWLDIEVNSSAIFEDGRFAGSRDIVRDITGCSENRSIEEALRLSERRLAESQRIAHLGNWEWDVATGKVFWSDEVYRIYGVDKKTFAPSYEEVVKAMHDETKDKFHKAIEDALNGARPFDMEYKMVRPDGAVRVIHTIGEVVRGSNGEAIRMVGIAQDVTESKMGEELLRAQKLEAVGVLAGGIAHDFNNFLTSILNNIYLAKMYLNEGDKAFQTLLAAEKASFRAKALTQQLLTFSKGGFPVRKPVSLGSLVEESADFALRGSNVVSEYRMVKGLWPVDADEGLISQAIGNIIINASQAMPDGGRVKISAENFFIKSSSAVPLPEGRYVMLSIADEGIGIPEEFIGKIFDPYFTTKQRGSGLGLTATYSIVRKHNGHISVESRLGEGTVFHIYLPASTKETQPEKAAERVSVKGFGRILIIDDEKGVRDSLAEVLAFSNYEVEVSGDGREAIENYSYALQNGRPFNAVIIDLTVPGGMGGVETIRELLKVDPAVKAIVSSGYSTDPAMSEYRKHGFMSVLAKPYQPDEVCRILSEVMGVSNTTLSHSGTT